MERTQQALLGVLQFKVLVWELGAINALATSAISLSEVSSLNHELLDDSVKGRSLVAEAILASCKCSEVLSGLAISSFNVLSSSSRKTHLWYSLAVKAHHNSSQRLISVCDVEVDFMCDFWSFSGLSGLCEEDKNDSEDQKDRDQGSLKACHDCNVLMWL